MTDEPTTASDDQPVAVSSVDPKLLDILVCPLTKATLRYDRERQELISDEAGLAYPIRDGIPIMLVDEARTLGEDEAIPDAVKARPSASRGKATS
ncbi:MAG: Trm112 family protein [Alphaproteobacteria bacterium]